MKSAFAVNDISITYNMYAELWLYLRSNWTRWNKNDDHILDTIALRRSRHCQYLTVSLLLFNSWTDSFLMQAHESVPVYCRSVSIVTVMMLSGHRQKNLISFYHCVRIFTKLHW
jgi:hypothetical protein